MADAVERVLLVAAGECDQRLLTELLESNSYVIAVDGGLDRLRECDFKPAAVIGDMDSASGLDSLEDVLIVESGSQQDSDLVKSILWALDRGASEVDIIGIEAGASDHVLGTYAALAEVCQRSDRVAQIRLHQRDAIVHLLREGSNWYGDLPAARQLSVFSLGPPAHLSMRGVRWPLSTESLEFSTRGLHNESSGGMVEVEVQSGCVLLFIAR